MAAAYHRLSAADNPTGQISPRCCSLFLVLTVREAARVAGRDEETIRRWIRAGRLPSHRDGPRHLVAREDLERLLLPHSLPLPPPWERASGAGAQLDWVAAVRRSRGTRD